jgi:hypothetical protein
LERCISRIVDEWLLRVKENKTLNHVSLTDKERTGYLPKLIEDLIVRLRAPNTPAKESDSPRSAAADCKATQPGCWCMTRGYFR